jgi:hypothetical protein
MNIIVPLPVTLAPGSSSPPCEKSFVGGASVQSLTNINTGPRVPAYYDSRVGQAVARFRHGRNTAPYRGAGRDRSPRAERMPILA